MLGEPGGVLGESSFHVGELERKAGMRRVVNVGKGQDAWRDHRLVPREALGDGEGRDPKTRKSPGRNHHDAKKSEMEKTSHNLIAFLGQG